MLQLDHILATLLDAFLLVKHNGAIEFRVLTNHGLVLQRRPTKALVLSRIVLERAILHVEALRERVFARSTFLGNGTELGRALSLLRG